MTSPQPGYGLHFGINNIPFGVASSQTHPDPACVTRYEDDIVFLDRFSSVFDGLLDRSDDIFGQASLNAFAALPRSTHQAVRQRLQHVFCTEGWRSSLPVGVVEPIAAVYLHLPVTVGDFTDFSCSHHHVQNASEAMTGKRSAPPAFFHMPIGYAGRCSSLDVSVTPVERPVGQYWEGKPGESNVVFGASKRMDYELELGCIIGKPLARRQRILASQANEHIFGYVLVNDWSARDIQALEMNPLGPLNGKNSGTTISPWVITTDALERHRTTSPPRTQGLAPYLEDNGHDALDIALQVHVAPSDTKSAEGSILCKSNSAWMYWTLGQCLAHQAIGGCGLRTGDVMATGTVSGQGAGEHGCLLEHMRVGENPSRGYLEDGEAVTLSGYCGDGVGFGECVATLMPAKDLVA